MNFRRQNMSNAEYRIDFNSSSNDLEQTETFAEEILHQLETSTHSPPSTSTSTTTTTTTTQNLQGTPIDRPTRVGMNDDHLHQIIQFCKDNLTSTFPFALILILKGFYEHSAGSSSSSSSSISHHCFSLSKEFSWSFSFRQVFIMEIQFSFINHR